MADLTQNMTAPTNVAMQQNVAMNQQNMVMNQPVAGYVGQNQQLNAQQQAVLMRKANRARRDGDTSKQRAFQAAAMNVGGNMMNQMSRPPNAIDIAADLIPGGKMMYTPMTSSFESMGQGASMPKELLEYMTRQEYAAKMEELNVVIEKWTKYWSGAKCKTCALFPLFFTIILFPLCIVYSQHAVNKLRRELTKDVNALFKDWKAKGLGVIFLPGEKTCPGAGDLFDTPNIVRVILPVHDEEEEAASHMQQNLAQAE